jgi:RHS repeat-associated protein
VTIAYDPLYPRPIIVQDGTGTTVLQYVPAGTLGAGQLAEQDSPDGGSAVIKNTYDVLGRISTQALGSATEMLTYDTIGRVSLDQSALGTFQYNYLGQTAQVTAEVLQGNTWQSAYGYGTNAQDRQLQSIIHPSTTGASNISYTTGPENQILSRADAPSMQASPYDPIVSYVVDGDNRVQSANNIAWIYDANGNVLDDGTNTYQWDADNRLTFITNKSGGHVSQFKYDGFSRRTVIIEKANASATPVETHYLWCGSAPCESHTATGQQLALYFRQGEIAIGGNAPYYYARDSLGSVMQVVNANGALLGKAQYTNYGTVVLASGAVPTFGYAGMFQHAPSLTDFTLYRVYSPTSERWLSRDPLEEIGGRNLYAYVGGNPISNVDPLGLWSVTVGGYAGIGTEVSFGVDNGHFFLTDRWGFGFGGGIGYDPEGGIPGGTRETGCRGGVVLSDSFQAGGNLGPLGVGTEVGAFRNYTTGASDIFGSPPHFVGGGEWRPVIRGVVSVGGQITLYTGVH